MSILLPKQHGAWAMLVIPFLLSMIASIVTIWHLFLFFGWFFLYLMTYPFTMLCKGKKKEYYLKWVYIYSFLSLCCLLIVGVHESDLIYFGLSIIPFFCINLYYAKKKKERAFLNDIAAIIVFCIGGLASYYLGEKHLNVEAWQLFIYSFLYFLGTTFYVKTMIREKNNQAFKYYSWIYHVGVLLLIILVGDNWLIIAYIPSAIRAFALYGKKLSVMKIGMIEIFNSLYFCIVMIIAIT